MDDGRGSAVSHVVELRHPHTQGACMRGAEGLPLWLPCMHVVCTCMWFAQAPVHGGAAAGAAAGISGVA